MWRGSRVVSLLTWPTQNTGKNYRPRSETFAERLGLNVTLKVGEPSRKRFVNYASGRMLELEEWANQIGVAAVSGETVRTSIRVESCVAAKRHVLSIPTRRGVYVGPVV